MALCPKAISPWGLEGVGVAARGRANTVSRRMNMRRVLAFVALLAVAGAMLFPARAEAYLVRGPVYVGLSQSYVELEANQSAAVSCVVDPITEDQLPGCFESYCPEGCGDIGCLDANGWCTCMGYGYARYSTSVVTMSNDPSVARADWSGGVLYVNAYDVPGTVTITISASLRNHAPDQVAYVTVVVNEPPLIPDNDPNSQYINDDPEPGDDPGSGDDPETNEPEPDDNEGVDGGEGDADTNVVDGTGDSKDAKLDPGASSDPDASFEKPDAAAPKEAESALEATPETPDAPEAPEPEVPEVPVEPDIAKPVRLYELEEVEAPEDDDRGIDKRYAGTTALTSLICIGVGAVRRVDYRRRQMQ